MEQGPGPDMCCAGLCMYVMEVTSPSMEVSQVAGL